MRDYGSNKKIILVDSDDRQVGMDTKINVHRLGLLHRAYSIFVFRTKKKRLELLLQQRAIDKYHSGGLWSNTCCSHPEPDIDMLEHAQWRLQQEMGFTVLLKRVGVFQYCSHLSNGIIESEIDHLFIGFTDIEEIKHNREEVLDTQWVAIAEIMKSIQKKPENYTSWFFKGLMLVLRELNF